jgi:hypothetical protein
MPVLSTLFDKLLKIFPSPRAVPRVWFEVRFPLHNGGCATGTDCLLNASEGLLCVVSRSCSYCQHLNPDASPVAAHEGCGGLQRCALMSTFVCERCHINLATAFENIRTSDAQLEPSDFGAELTRKVTSCRDVEFRVVKAKESSGAGRHSPAFKWIVYPARAKVSTLLQYPFDTALADQMRLGMPSITLQAGLDGARVDSTPAFLTPLLYPDFFQLDGIAPKPLRDVDAVMLAHFLHRWWLGFQPLRVTRLANQRAIGYALPLFTSTPNTIYYNVLHMYQVYLCCHSRYPSELHTGGLPWRSQAGAPRHAC